MMHVCPNITHAMLIDLSPCMVGIVSSPTDFSQIVTIFFFSEKDNKISLHKRPEKNEIYFVFKFK